MTELITISRARRIVDQTAKAAHLLHTLGQSASFLQGLEQRMEQEAEQDAATAA